MSNKKSESEKKYQNYYEKNPIRFLFMDEINKSGKKPRSRGELKKEKERIKKYSRGGGVAVQGTKFKGSY